MSENRTSWAPSAPYAVGDNIATLVNPRETTWGRLMVRLRLRGIR